MTAAVEKTKRTACGEFIRQWGEIAEAGTAVKMEISVRTCIPDNSLAIVCLLSNFPTHHVPSIRNDKFLDCVRYVVRPHSRISAFAMYDRLKLAAESVVRSHNANKVRHHVLSMWEAVSAAIADANCWSLYKNAGTMWGTWKPSAGKSFSKAFIEALRAHQFRTSARDELIIDDTPMQNPENVCRRVLHLADQWSETQRLVDAVVDSSYRCSRGGRGPITEDDIKSNQYQGGRGYSRSFKSWGTENNHSGGVRNIQMPEYGEAKEIFFPRAFPMFQVPSVRASVFVAKRGGASSAKKRFYGTNGTPPW